MKNILIVLCALVLLGYCGASKSRVSRYYEDGIEIVQNPLVPPIFQGESLSLNLEKEFAIDLSTKELLDNGLINIWHFDIDSEANIYLNSTRPDKIFKFDQNGKFIGAFGKKDAETGDYFWPKSIRISDDNEILTVSGAETILFLGTDGRLIREIGRDTIAEIPSGIPNEQPRNSELLDVFPLSNGYYLIYKSLNYYTVVDHYCPLILCGPEWKELKHLDGLKVPGIAQAKFDKIKGFFPRFSWTVTKKRIYVGNDENGYEIHTYDLEGKLLRKIRKDHVGVDVTNEYKEKILNMFKDAPWKDKIYFPDKFPAFQYIFSDDEDHLFVMTYEKDENGAGYIYDIFNDEGVYIGRTSLDNYGLPTYHHEGGEGPLEVSVKNRVLYCNQMTEDGRNTLVVYKMTWK
jgi:hypothetical protein